MNEIATKPNVDTTLPAHLAKRAINTELTAAARSGLPEGMATISLAQSRFTAKMNGQEKKFPVGGTLAVVIVGATPGKSKNFYHLAYDPGQEPVAPDCFSVDGEYPDPSAPDPQSDGGPCQGCPMNQWGSKAAKFGGESQAKRCTDRKVLAVVSAGRPGDFIYKLAIPPTSLSAFGNYVGTLSKRGIPLECAITELSFVDDKTGKYQVLDFTFAGYVDAESLATIDNIIDTGAAKHITHPEPRVGEVTAEVKAEAEPEPAEEKVVKPAAKKPAAKKAEPKAETVAESKPEPVKTAEPADAGDSSVAVVDSDLGFGAACDAVLSNNNVAKKPPVVQADTQSEGLEDDEIPF